MICCPGTSLTLAAQHGLLRVENAVTAVFFYVISPLKSQRYGCELADYTPIGSYNDRGLPTSD